MLSVPACHARDRSSIARRVDEYTFLVQDFIWKKQWKIAEKWYANDIVTQFLGSIVVSIPACRVGDRNWIPYRREEWSFYLRILFKTTFGERRSTKKSNHVIPRYYSDEYPRLSRGRPGFKCPPRRWIHCFWLSSGFYLKTPLKTWWKMVRKRYSNAVPQ